MHLKRLILYFMITLLSGCFDRLSGATPTIRTVSPNPMVLGERATVKGLLFPADSRVFVDGQNATVEDISGREITIRVPRQAAAGHRLLLLRSPSLTNSMTYPVEIVSRNMNSSPDAQQPVSADFGTALPQDQFTDAGIPNRLLGVFSPDPSTEGAVTISSIDQVDGQLQLRIDLPESAGEIWGVAFHLVYDPNIMVFRSVSNRDTSRAFQIKEAPIGRLLVGWILQAEDQRQLDIHFDLVGRGEARLDFPIHHRTLRDENNNPVPNVSCLTGSVRVREVNP
ncbi:MAG: IPT/TIG domain-containing protein [Myxococcota bacterium]|nr:IPT/TIG domain-containing protein [Myxococcota bacterium]